MTLRVRRAFGEVLISIGALAALLTTLVLVDDRVREQVSMRFSAGRASDELANVGAQATSIVGVVVEAARHQSLDHAPMLIFALAATVLVLFMLRT